jgi:hypothetical protein
MSYPCYPTPSHAAHKARWPAAPAYSFIITAHQHLSTTIVAPVLPHALPRSARSTWSRCPWLLIHFNRTPAPFALPLSHPCFPTPPPTQRTEHAELLPLPTQHSAANNNNKGLETPPPPPTTTTPLALCQQPPRWPSPAFPQ